MGKSKGREGSDLKRIVLTAVMTMLSALLFSACARAKNDMAAATLQIDRPKTDAPASTPYEAHEKSVSAAVITLGIVTNDEGMFFLPRIEGEAGKAINLDAEHEVLHYAAQIDEQIFTSYKITANSGGIFSAIIYMDDLKTDEHIGLLPINYDLQTGKKLSICDYFDPENDRWRRVLPDIVTLQAESRGLTLLCDVLPISDAQLYYISGDKLVLVYRQYEITTYADSMPQFSVPIAQLKEFLPETSPLTRFMHAAAPVTLEPQAVENTIIIQDDSTPTPTEALSEGGKK